MHFYWLELMLVMFVDWKWIDDWKYIATDILPGSKGLCRIPPNYVGC